MDISNEPASSAELVEWRKKKLEKYRDESGLPEMDSDPSKPLPITGTVCCCWRAQHEGEKVPASHAFEGQGGGLFATCEGCAPASLFLAKRPLGRLPVR